MPLTLPNLDDRRWESLVEEARALIPRYTPEWTDHNAHDPGIMVTELFAWLVEQDLYRLNRIPDRYRRKFLALLGYAPLPPRPAHTTLAFVLQQGAGEQALPAGLIVSSASTPRLYFRTLASLTVVEAQIKAVQVYDGSGYMDQTRLWRDGIPFTSFGTQYPSPGSTGADVQPAIYLGFDQTLPDAGQEVCLWFSFQGIQASRVERLRVQEEARQVDETCRIHRRPSDCLPDHAPSIVPDTWREHHGLRLAWDYYDGMKWQGLVAEDGELVDETRSFTLDGNVRLKLPQPMSKIAIGTLVTEYFYLRCRVEGGSPDALPIVSGILLNAVDVEQSIPAIQHFLIGKGVLPPEAKEPTVGQINRLYLQLNGKGLITSLEAGDAPEWIEAFVTQYQPATDQAEGILVVACVWVGKSSGTPNEQMSLLGAPVDSEQVALWTVDERVTRWQQRSDLDASSRKDADFTLDTVTGTVVFGDGERGRVAPSGADVFATYRTTLGTQGNGSSHDDWNLIVMDSLGTYNSALLKMDVAAAAGKFQTIAGGAVSDGSDEESLDEATGRVVETLWAHERLIALCGQTRKTTLDQMARASVLSIHSPGRASTLVDFERLALDVPGASVARAHAWGGIDPNYPCLNTPGTVTVIIVSNFPLDRPLPTPGLLARVRRYLNRRKVVGTRLVIAGPDYLEIGVKVTVRAKNGARAAQVHDAIDATIKAFLHPLKGGPDRCGWPFGRDVYRSEILQQIDAVSGVDYVVDLELVSDTRETNCSNVCLNPTELVVSGQHTITVVTG